MGNKITSPLPSYETAVGMFSPQDVAQMQVAFRVLCRQQDTVTLDALIMTANASEFASKRIIPRMFALLDTKKQHCLTIEDYFAMNALFAFGTPEDRVKFLFLMYDQNKSGYLTKEALIDLFIDANAVSEQPNMPMSERSTYVSGLRELLETMVDMVMWQYAPSTPGKMSLQNFGAFFQIEGSLHTLLTVLPSFLHQESNWVANSSGERTSSSSRARK